MKRKLHVVGNWKMHHDVQSNADFWSELDGEAMPDSVVFGIAPQAPLLSDSILKCPFKSQIYAQNCHQELKGAYTGELSSILLKSIGCAGVVLGHSERRQYFGESDELILAKARTAIEQKLKVIYCCGESLETRKAGEQVGFVRNQLSESLFHLSIEELTNVIVAYEPIWAIGTGETASAQQAEDMCLEIRKMLAEKFGQDLADAMVILYGGSVKPANAEEIFSMPNVDGGLVGGASLKPESFSELINIAAQVSEK